MIAHSVVASQMVRLWHLPGRPPDPEGQPGAGTREVEQAYAARAKNAKHAQEMASWILRHCTFFPSPAEVYEAAEACFSDDYMPQPDRHCPRCDGTGYEQLWVLITQQRTPGGGLYTSRDRISDRDQAAMVRARIGEGVRSGAISRGSQELCDAVRACRACDYGKSIGTQPAVQESQHGASGREGKDASRKLPVRVRADEITSLIGAHEDPD